MGTEEKRMPRKERTSRASGRKKKPSFEEALAELTEIVDHLESGEMGLDESVEQFERGIQLARVCSERLREAERRLEKLVGDEDGGFRVEEVTVYGGGSEESDEPSSSSGDQPPEEGESGPARGAGTHELPF